MFLKLSHNSTVQDFKSVRMLFFKNTHWHQLVRSHLQIKLMVYNFDKIAPFQCFRWNFDYFIVQLCNPIRRRVKEYLVLLVTYWFWRVLQRNYLFIILLKIFKGSEGHVFPFHIDRVRLEREVGARGRVGFLGTLGAKQDWDFRVGVDRRGFVYI